MSGVTYSNAYKRSLPNYENITVFFSLSLDIPEDVSSKEDAEAFVSKEMRKAQFVKEAVEAKVDAWLLEKINEIDEDAK